MRYSVWLLAAVVVGFSGMLLVGCLPPGTVMPGDCDNDNMMNGNNAGNGNQNANGNDNQNANGNDNQNGNSNANGNKNDNGNGEKPQPTPLRAVRVATGFDRPVFLTAAPGDLDRLFVVEQHNARILIMRDGEIDDQPFLDLGTENVATGNEQGLLGMAFHPNYDENGWFYVNYNEPDGTTVVARYEVSADPDVADAESGQDIIRIQQPFSNHNAGMLAFGPLDGYLYIGTGDGGSGNDPGNRAQDRAELLGKMLRIDVNDQLPFVIPDKNPFVGSPGARAEIWAEGLRNPWRYSFDRVTGDLWIGDVGQSAREEIDFQSGSSSGGENYGWRCIEGNLCTGLSGCACEADNLTPPVFEYGHNEGGCSVTGGYVYRGCAIPDLSGVYFFGDYCTGQIWSAQRDNKDGRIDVCERTEELTPGEGSIDNISSFGEDAAGELYILDLEDGEIYRIEAADDTNGCEGS